MISPATRAANHSKVVVLCADCGTRLERAVCAAWRQSVCKPCRRQRERKRKGIVRAARRVGVAVVQKRPSFYMTLTVCPDDSWPAGHSLLRREWEALVAAGDLAGARFVDSQGRAWAAVDGEIVVSGARDNS